MKLLVLMILIIFSFTGCQDNSPYKKKPTPSMQKGYYSGVNPNSLASRSEDKKKDRENLIKISKLDAETKIEIAKIESNQKIKVAKVHAQATMDVAKTDSITKIKTTKIDAVTKKDDIQSRYEIAMVVGGVFVIAIFFLYLHGKRNRDLKHKLHHDKLLHERILKEKELEEQRLHKMLALIGEGKLAPEVEQELILSLTKPKQNFIESTPIEG